MYSLGIQSLSEKFLEFWVNFFTYVSANYMKILYLTWEHIYISGIALLLTVIICIPTGIYITRNEKLAPYVIGFANICQTIPSLALLGMLISVVGIGDKNAIIALTLYALLPVLQNTYTGIKNVPKSATEAGRGVGMTEFQILKMVELPLARPVIIAGIRVASVWIIGTATLAAAIGGGGLGSLIFSGLSFIRNDIIFAGALPATTLALSIDYGLKKLQEAMSPKRRAARLNKLAENKAKDSNNQKEMEMDA